MVYLCIRYQAQAQRSCIYSN